MSSFPPSAPSASSSLSFFRMVGFLKTVPRTGWLNHGIPAAKCESVADHMYRMSMMVFMLTDRTVDKDRLLKICLVHDLAEALVGDITPQQAQEMKKGQKQLMEKEAMLTIAATIVGGTSGDAATGHAAEGSGDLASSIADELLSLWFEYEGISPAESTDTSSVNTGNKEGSVLKRFTPESSLAHQLDKLEMIVQADEYERREGGEGDTAASGGSRGTGTGAGTGGEQGAVEHSRGPAFLQDFFDSTATAFTHPEVLQWADLLRGQRQARIAQWEERAGREAPRE